METKGISEVLQYWPLFATGAGVLIAFGIYKARSHKKRNSDNQNMQGTVVPESRKIEEEEQEETEELEKRNISQLLKREIDEEDYTLKARVEKVHAIGDEYRGILSDETGKMPFYYQNEDSLSNDIAGILFHESRDDQSKLELAVTVMSHFEDESSKILWVKSVRGKIGELDYETGEEY